MNTQTATTMKTVADLTAFVVSECTSVDREARFDSMLDDCYSFSEIGGPFAHMSPSSVLKECDPTAYRCGVNDFADSEGWIEIEGENYESDDVEKAREEFLDGLRYEVKEIEDARDDADQLPLDLERELEALESSIAELEAHTF